MGKPAEAIAAYRTATTLSPRYGLAHFNLGATLKDLERLEEAIGAFRQALACEPDLAPARFQLCNVRRHACDWRGLDREDADCLAGLRRDGVRVSPFPILAMSADPAVHLEHTRLWARGLIVSSADILPARRIDVSQGRRIRLGYLSSDFQRHATASLIAELLERHDRRRFEVFGYCFSPDDGSDVRKRLLAAFDAHVDVRRLSHAQAARRIHEDGIDILVDLKGYTKDARTEILAHRPAPVQVNFLGYPGSMGADFIDYIIADAFVAPMHLQPSFAERIVHLPDSYQPNDRRRQISPRGAVARPMRLAGDGVRVLLVQQRLQDHRGDVRAVDAPARGRAGKRAVAAGRRPPRQGQPAARGGDAGRRSGPPGVRTQAAHAGAPGAAAARRPVPRYRAGQRPYHRQRRPVGRAAGADLCRAMPSSAGWRAACCRRSACPS